MYRTHQQRITVYLSSRKWPSLQASVPSEPCRKSGGDVRYSAYRPLLPHEVRSWCHDIRPACRRSVCYRQSAHPDIAGAVGGCYRHDRVPYGWRSGSRAYGHRAHQLFFSKIYRSSKHPLYLSIQFSHLQSNTNYRKHHTVKATYFRRGPSDGRLLLHNILYLLFLLICTLLYF